MPDILTLADDVAAKTVQQSQENPDHSGYRLSDAELLRDPEVIKAALESELRALYMYF